MEGGRGKGREGKGESSRGKVSEERRKRQGKIKAKRVVERSQSLHRGSAPAPNPLYYILCFNRKCLRSASQAQPLFMSPLEAGAGKSPPRTAFPPSHGPVWWLRRALGLVRG